MSGRTILLFRHDILLTRHGIQRIANKHKPSLSQSSGELVGYEDIYPDEALSRGNTR